MENSYSMQFSFTQEDVVAFSRITGDTNPIHLDEAYASKSIFKRRIVHGFLAGSVFSKIFGTAFPGEGTIYLSQELRFLAPMYTDEKYTATVTIEETFPEKSRAKVKTVISDGDGKIVIDGKAVIINSIYGKNAD